MNGSTVAGWLKKRALGGYATFRPNGLEDSVFYLLFDFGRTGISRHGDGSLELAFDPIEATLSLRITALAVGPTLVRLMQTRYTELNTHAEHEDQ